MVGGAYVFDVFGEGEPLVAGESPHLTAGGGDAGDCADHGEEDQDGGHECGCRYGVCGVVEDLDDGDARLGWGREAEHVVLPVRTEAEAQGDEHEEAEQGVEKGAPHHGGGQDARSVFQLFGHVGAGVGAEETP